MKKFLAIGCVALAGLLMFSGESQAGRFQISFGSNCGPGGYGGYYGGGYGGGRSWSSFSYGSGSLYRSGRNRVWHDTSHLHYHAPEIYRHRNHYHVTPGHYDVHRSGHWHRR